jgi:acetyl-CoA acetyltransferase
MTRSSRRCEVAIVGYAQSPTYRHAPVPLGALTLETCLKAIADAGLSKEQIDGFTTGSTLPSAAGRTPVDGIDIVTGNWIAEQLGVHARWLGGFQGAGQIPGAVILAVNAIASGAADYVLVHRALSNPPGRYHENPMTRAAGSSQWTAPQGFWGPPAMMAMAYMEYMQRYGATREDLGRVLVELRRHAAKIPWAYWYGKPITLEDYLNARMIADPICVLDCDIPIDGAVAFVFTSAERARDHPNRPVYVAGYAQGNPVIPSPMWSLPSFHAGAAYVGRDLWASTGLTRDDIDLPQLYDGFSPIVYFWLETLGYCKRGEAHLFIREQNDLTRFFSGGGSLGNGRMHGVPPMLECYLQLSQRAGDRQLRGLRTGLACHSYPQYGGVVAYSAERL